jgi:parvulin-like peptidyl-prolyl isomerase
VPAVADQVWARHILVASEEEAKQVIGKLKAGEDWQTLAAEVSIDTGTKSTGGDLGWFPKGVMVAEFENAAFTQTLGEISTPVKTSMGYHVIQVLGHEDRPLAANYLSQAKQKVYSAWIDKLRTQETITINDIWKNYVPTEPTVQMPSQ